MNKIEFDTIIISDLHLGSKLCLSKDLLIFLENVRVRNLILNGDIFNDLKFYRLRHFDWEVISQLRKMSDHCSVYWNRGNHDLIDERFMSCLLGVQVRKGTYFKIGKNNFYAEHGDRWDNTIKKYKLITKIVTWLYTILQNVKSDWAISISKFFNQKTMDRNYEGIKLGALRLAKENGIKGIFCGHTHTTDLMIDKNTIYGNSGDWESSQIGTFIGINKKEICLCSFKNKKYEIIKTIKIG